MEAGQLDARVAAMVRDHEQTLLRTARRYCFNHDDAQDAYQRGLEIYLRRLEHVDPATELAWLRVVVKHEALAVRRARQELLAEDDVDLDGHEADGRSLPERYEAAERARRSAEALRALKHDEALALMLKAEGFSYAEIGRRLSWTYTNVLCSLGPSTRQAPRSFKPSPAMTVGCETRPRPRSRRFALTGCGSGSRQLG